MIDELERAGDVFDWGDPRWETVTVFLDGARSAVMTKVVEPSGGPVELDVPRALATALLMLALRLDEHQMRLLVTDRDPHFPVGDPVIVRGKLEETRPNAFDFSGGSDSVYAFIDEGWSSVMVEVVASDGGPVQLIPPEAYRLATALLVLAERLDEADNDEYGREREFIPYRQGAIGDSGNASK
jgi:hypothetical protein